MAQGIWFVNPNSEDFLEPEEWAYIHEELVRTRTFGEDTENLLLNENTELDYDRQ